MVLPHEDAEPVELSYPLIQRHLSLLWMIMIRKEIMWIGKLNYRKSLLMPRSMGDWLYLRALGYL